MSRPLLPVRPQPPQTKLPLMTPRSRTQVDDAVAPAAGVVGDPAPNPHATAEQVEAALKDTKLAQILYHDWEAETYDDKWSISYDQRCVDYARGRFDAAVPDAVQRELPYDRALELGCGTGFFLLNLIQAGVARRGSVTDLSPGMVKVATRNGQSLGLDIDGKVADAEGIPYPDDTFDLVVGHAVLHHIPDVELSLREVVRVLKPGGRFVFAGEPTTIGNRYARELSTLTWHIATNVTKLPGLRDWRRSQTELDESSRAAALEAVVDLHTFEPADLERMARNAGAVEVDTASEEFTAAMLGWPVRTFEAAVPPGKLGWGWAKFAFGSWTTLSWVDANVWRRVMPKGWFYNVMVTGVKPADGSKPASQVAGESPVTGVKPGA
jgi:ubiquinone/menaquinone biosynthesis C-methylase UbiE